MGPVPKNIEEHQRGVAEDKTGFHDLPTLENQQSLQDLVAADLQSRDDVSIEMAALLLRRTTADIAIPPSETQIQGARTILKSTDNGEGSQDPKPKGLQFNFKPLKEHFRRWTAKRRGATFEQPKVVYSHKRRKILRQILVFHLVPVSINFALLGLYVRQVLWVPPWPTTNILNTLQFAAKVHETLMVVSLASVLLHHIRYRLLSTTHGLPLGLVTSPFRLLDLTYLWSKEFLAAWSAEGGSRKVLTIVIHFYLFILAAVLGPASAISMLPRLGERDLASTIAKVPFGGVGLEAYIGGLLSDIYPQRITGSFSPEACDYGNLTHPQTNSCPRYGLEDILHDWLPADFDTGHRAAVYQQPVEQYTWDFNVTVQKHGNYALRPRTIDVKLRAQTFGHHETVVDATTPPDSISLLMQWLLSSYPFYWLLPKEYDLAAPYGFRPTVNRRAKLKLYPGLQHPDQAPASWKQPLVSSFCSLRMDEIDESGVLSFAFDQCVQGYVGGYNCGQKYEATLNSTLLPTKFKDTGMGFVNVSTLEINPSFTPSAAFIYTQVPNITLCLIKANWVDVTIAGFIPSDYNYLSLDRRWQTPNPDWIEEGGTWFNDTNPSQIIQLDLDWLSALDEGTGRNRGFSFFERLRQACLDWLVVKNTVPNQPGKELSTACMTFGITLGMTEGLSKIPYHFGIHVIGYPASFPGVDDPDLALTLSPWTDIDPRPAPPYSSMEEVNWTSTLSSSEVRKTSTRLDFVVSEQLYGYGFDNITIILAFIVLFLYATTVIFHIFIMSFGTRWSSRAWKSLGEFLVLAVRSPTPSVLENTGGGVKSSLTWKARVSIQEFQGGNNVGMRVEKPGLSGTKDISESRVRPDWKYS